MYEKIGTLSFAQKNITNTTFAHELKHNYTLHGI